MASDISITEEDAGFLLSVGGSRGRTQKIKLSSDQVIALATSAQSMRSRALLKQNPTAENLVVAVPISHFDLKPDALWQVALLTLFDRIYLKSMLSCRQSQNS
jgi:hypothetical protein